MKPVFAVHSVSLNASLKSTPAVVLLRVDNAHAVMNGVRNSVLALQIDPIGEVHDLVGESLYVEIVQRGRAHDHLQPFAVVAEARYHSKYLHDQVFVALRQQTINLVQNKEPYVL